MKTRTNEIGEAMRGINRTIRAYTQNKSGNFAVWFALMAFPLLAATSLVIDYRTTEANTAGIKTALDSAVLAAVANDSLDRAGKEALAKEVFDLHYKGAAKLQLSPKATDGRVEMTASGEIGTSVGRAVGYNKFDISETSIAEMNRENTICVLALAMEGREKLRFLDSTEFNSPTCSVQSNSKDAVGVMSTTKHAPVAKSFCSAGGAVGDFLPNLRGQCRQIGDPYINRSAPTPGLCMPSSIFQSTSHTSVLGDLSVEDLTVAGILKLTSGNKSWVKFLDFGTVFSILGSGFDKNNPAEVAIVEAALVEEVLKALRLSELGITDRQIERLEQDYSADLLEVSESTNYTGHNMVLSPGTYCGGLTVDGKNVTFLPGTYIMKDGPLTFKNGSQATAKDVSFVMHGETAVVTVESNSYVDVKAPRSGTMAGLAFFQDQNVKLTGLQKDQVPPTGVNIVSSGGELNVTGTMYFPTQALEVVGDSILGAKAPATSFIAHQVTFSGETKAAVQVDHVKGGIPPMLPRSDDGARLVQ